jgi:hypothetical protein
LLRAIPEKNVWEGWMALDLFWMGGRGKSKCNCVGGCLLQKYNWIGGCTLNRKYWEPVTVRKYPNFTLAVLVPFGILDVYIRFTR